MKDILDRFDLKNYRDVRDKSNKRDIKIIREFLKISCPIEKAPEASPVISPNSVSTVAFPLPYPTEAPNWALAEKQKETNAIVNNNFFIINKF